MVLETQIQRGLAVSSQTALSVPSPARPLITSQDLTLSAIDGEFEKILTWAQTHYGEDEFVVAKDEFFWKAGKVFHDDPFYEQRMSYFLDFFLLQRAVQKAEQFITPFVNYQAHIQASGAAACGLTDFVHSAFQVLRVTDKLLTVNDLFTELKYIIDARPYENFRALNRKDIFQGFIYASGTTFFLSHGVIFHPCKTHKIIKKNLKRQRRGGEFEPVRELALLSRKQLKHLRHAHVDPRRIYNEVEI